MIYEEDRFHPNNKDDNWTELMKQNSTGSASSMFLEPIKKFECIIPCKIGYKKMQIKCYKSVVNIRNAITGVQTNDLVGSKNEYLYFKVAYPNVGLLFFNGPEEYERHFYAQVSEKTKTEWRNRKMT